MILPLLNFCWKLFYTVSRPRQSDAKKASSAWNISLAFQGHGIGEHPGICINGPWHVCCGGQETYCKQNMIYIRKLFLMVCPCESNGQWC